MKRLILILAILLPPLVFFAQQRKVLHYTETKGYNHNTKTQSLAMFNSWATMDSFTVTNDDDGSEFTSLANLQQYDVVVWSNTSGHKGLTDAQEANFEAYIATGGSYLGIHAASDTYRHSSANGSSKGDWDYYAEQVSGATVQQSPNHTSSNHNNDMTKQVANHPILGAIPNPWNKTEEYYYWENGYLAPGFVELLRVGQTGSNSYDAPRMMAHCKDLAGGGRSFYTALGHSGNNFTSDQNFQQLIHDALIWTFDASSTQLGISDKLRSDSTKFEIVPAQIENGYILTGPMEIKKYRIVSIDGRTLDEGLIENEQIKLIQGLNFYITYGKIYKVFH